ncbi:MAG: MFS transporter [Alphaproteobacteria bacterium]|nr:MFS transporter [Alphaproteobacteria bacterium]MCB9696253.1 MFS transporter [Alphaproteobacteria bacterium]
MRRLEGNLSRYLLFGATLHTPVFVPVVVLFWTERGLDLSDVYLLQAVYAVAVVLLEVPTGMLADRWGKRASLLAAAAIYAIGFVVYGFGEGFWWFLGAELVLGVAGALFSGADSALLYDTLAALDRRDEFASWEGRSRALQMVVFSVANVVGGLVATWSLPATLWLSAVGPTVAVFVAATMVEARPPVAAATWAEGWERYRALVSGALRFVRKHRRVRFHLLALALLTGSSSWLLWMVQPYMTENGVPLWSFGLVFGLYNLVAALFSALAHRLASTLGDRATLLLLWVLQAAPLLLMALFPSPAAFLFVLGQQAARGWGRPVITGWVLQHTWEDKRSTVLSVGSLGGRLFFATTAPVVGWALDAWSLSGALLLQVAALILAGGLLAIESARIPEKYLRVKPDRS